MKAFQTPWHPSHILSPVFEVPTVPDEIQCLYDDNALMMYKCVMKAVRRFFRKDLSKLDDFKVNSRLFGNNFMEPHEYVDYLARDFGGLRMLQIVPCLIQIHPEVVKRLAILASARVYRSRHLLTLKQQCDHGQVHPTSDMPGMISAKTTSQRVEEHGKAIITPQRAPESDINVTGAGENRSDEYGLFPPPPDKVSTALSPHNAVASAPATLLSRAALYHSSSDSDSDSDFLSS